MLVFSCVSSDSCRISSHQNHIFLNPLCEEQSLCRRIANILFHVFTLCIPLIIYRLVCYFQQRSSLVGSVTGKRSSLGRDSFKSSMESIRGFEQIVVEGISAELLLSDRIASLSALGRQAFLFAHEQLQKIDPATDPEDKWMKSYQMPLVLMRLLSLQKWMLDSLNWNLEQQSMDDNPWIHSNVLGAASNLMKISFVISILSLTGLSIVQRKNGNFYEKMGVIETMIFDKAYISRLIYHFPQYYHNIRSGILADGVFKDPTSGHSSNFYDPEKVHNEWLSLYNEYSQHISSIISDNDVSEECESEIRLLKRWIQPDMAHESYKHPACDQPLNRDIFNVQ